MCKKTLHATDNNYIFKILYWSSLIIEISLVYYSIFHIFLLFTVMNLDVQNFVNEEKSTGL